jgi:hypothetical protein
VEVLAAVLGTHGPTVPIKHRVVGNLDFVIEIHKLLNVLMSVFHVVSLPNIADHSGTEALNEEF